MNLFSGFVPKLGEGGVWAFTRHFQRSLLAVELIYGWGLDPQTYDRSMFTKEQCVWCAARGEGAAAGGRGRG